MLEWFFHVNFVLIDQLIDRSYDTPPNPAEIVAIVDDMRSLKRQLKVHLAHW